VCTLTKRFDDQGEVEEAKEEHVEILEAGEEQPLSGQRKTSDMNLPNLK
jgi:hypothetical protein